MAAVDVDRISTDKKYEDGSRMCISARVFTRPFILPNLLRSNADINETASRFVGIHVGLHGGRSFCFDRRTPLR